MTPAARTVDAGDLTARKRLRHKLRCKDFRWYLEHVYKEAPVPLDFFSLGAVRPPIPNCTCPCPSGDGVAMGR